VARLLAIRLLLLLSCVSLWLWPQEALADVWSYEAPDGTVHFTNIPPKGKAAHKWQTVYKSGPGKAQAVSAVLSGASGGTKYPGCQPSRADVVPATDRSPERYTRYDAFIAEAAVLYALPQPLLRAIIKAESDYDPKVVSCAGARGLMQIMPEVEKDQRIPDVWDPRANILGGARLLRVLANRFQGDVVLTIAGYHAGAGAVLKYKGVPPYETTQAYVRAVLRHYQQYKDKAALGAR
jgi:soluble lytic murein transglycosylase-like protein